MLVEGLALREPDSYLSELTMGVSLTVGPVFGGTGARASDGGFA